MGKSELNLDFLYYLTDEYKWNEMNFKINEGSLKMGMNIINHNNIFYLFGGYDNTNEYFDIVLDSVDYSYGNFDGNSKTSFFLERVESINQQYKSKALNEILTTENNNNNKLKKQKHKNHEKVKLYTYCLDLITYAFLYIKCSCHPLSYSPMSAVVHSMVVSP